MTTISLKAGFAKECITPPLGLELSGYGYYLERRAEKILDDLYVRALALENGEDRLVLISCDLLGFNLEDSDRIRDAISEDLGLPLERIILSCTHTHCAPASQPLEGIGVPDPKYLSGLHKKIRFVAAKAFEDLRESGFAFARRTIEPIGYNRRSMKFEPIDPVLNSAIFRRKGGSIVLASYACHAIVRCNIPAVSSDWPGALCRALEGEGHEAIVFQGFCGDINPVNLKDKWRTSDPEPVGKFMSLRAIAALGDAEESAAAPIRAAEMRIRLPLNPLSVGEIEDQCRRHAIKSNAGFLRFLEWWRNEAMSKGEGAADSPWLDNVPVTAVRIGGLRMLGLPGEVFCRIAVPFQKKANAFTFGFCGGNVGYIPTSDAYEDPDDYAAWQATRFYSTLPFRPDVERTCVDAGLSLIENI